MHKLIIPIVLAGILLAAGFVLINTVQGQGSGPIDGPQVLQSETQGENRREIVVPPGSESLANAPAISFIDSPTITCYQPDPAKDACFINWYYMAVDASPNYMIAMTATIDSIGPVARFHGFFQNSMYVPFQMQDRGIQVECGALGAGGQSNLGNVYSWTVRAQDSANLKSTNYGSVYCPAYTP